MNNKNVNIIIGANGFPFTISAASNKFFYMAKSLVENEYHPYLLNLVNTTKQNVLSQGNCDSIDWLYVNYEIRNSFLKKLTTTIISNINLFSILKNKKSKTGHNSIIISYNSLILVFYYRLITWILGYRLVFSIMEYHPVIAKSLNKKIKAFLFWHVAFIFADGAIPISHFLKDVISSRFKKLPIHIIPALADFNVDEKITEYKKIPFFLYCGGIDYGDVIKIVIDAFVQLSEPNIELYLVISGSKHSVYQLKEILNEHKNIRIFHKISNQELYEMYSNAMGLLIPMRPNIQDKARFPQKVAEYVASGTPIITNSVGEISHYFEHGKTAIFANNFSVDSFKKSMQWVIKNPKASLQIGLDAKEMGQSSFHYQSIGKSYAHFLNSL